MNALEMAEAMEGRARVRRKITNRENTGDRLSDQLEQAATMLRQQQAELEALRKSHIELERGIVKDLNQRQSAEPVAYVNSMCNDCIDWKIEPMTIDGQSLYTHPVKEQLTDEEILEIILKYESASGNNDTYDVLDCIREVLRKAQE